MRKIEAIIRKNKFDSVKEGLIENDFNRFTYNLVNSVCKSEYSERVSLNIYVSDNNVDKALHIIAGGGCTGEIDDARINVLEVKETYQLICENDKDKLIKIL